MSSFSEILIWLPRDHNLPQASSIGHLSWSCSYNNHLYTILEFRKKMLQLPLAPNSSDTLLGPSYR